MSDHTAADDDRDLVARAGQPHELLAQSREPVPVGWRETDDEHVQVCAAASRLPLGVR